jgi:2-haloalkanoic acid dehalogenase type II
MERGYDIVTFDCYGTLVDWEGGICGAFRAAATEDGVELDDGAILAAHAAIEPQVQATSYRSYREVLTETAQRMARRLDWALDARRAAFLAESLPGWRPFEDTNPALRRLAAAGYRLGILSNVDDDLLAGTLRAIEVEIDPAVTAEQVRAYKPAHAHFEEARARIGAARWLHAAQSYFHDVEPAVALGIPVAWVNRHGERPPRAARPTREVADLRALADWLAGS